MTSHNIRAPSRAIYGETFTTSDEDLSQRALKALEDKHPERAKFLASMILSKDMRDQTIARIWKASDQKLKVKALLTFKEPEKAIEIAKSIFSQATCYETIARIIEVVIFEDAEKADELIKNLDADLAIYVKKYNEK